MFTAKRRSPDARHLLRLVGWLWFWGSLALLLFLLYRFCGTRIHSDHASDLVLSQLLAQQKALISRDWLYATELMVFNTQILYVPLFWLTSNWHLIRFLGTLLWIVLMLLSCLYFCRQMGHGDLFPYFGAVLILPLSDSYFDNILLGAYYIPYAIVSFFALGIVFRLCSDRTGRARPFLLAVYALLGVVSGLNGLRQLLVLYLPLLACSLLLWWRTKACTSPSAQWALPGAGVDRLLGLAAFGAVCSGMGFLVNSLYLSNQYSYKKYEESVHYIHLHDYRLEDVLNGWLDSFGYQSEGTALFDPTSLLHNALALVLVFICVAAAVRILRHGAEYGFPVWFLALFFCAGFFVYGALFLFTSMPHNPRYNLSIVVFCVPLIMIYFGTVQRKLWFRRAAAILLAAGVTACAGVYYQGLCAEDVNTAKREAAALLLEAGYTEGYATYWNANILTELTDGQIEVWALDESAQDAEDFSCVYDSLQARSHLDVPPSGKLFVLFTAEETESWLLPQRLDRTHILFENDSYTAYVYDSYAEIDADCRD